MKEKISSLQIGAITWCIILSTYMGIVPYILFYSVKQSSWISTLISFASGLLCTILYLYIWNKMPERNIFEKIEFIFGKKISSLISLIMTVGVLFMVSTYFYNMINFITSQYLTKTPNYFIMLIFSIPAIYIIIQKLEVIGRVFFTFFIIGITLFIITFLGLSTQLDFSNLLPIMENGINPIIKSSLVTLPYTNFILILLMSIPKNNVMDKEKINKRVIVFYCMASFAIFTGIIFITTSLGGELATTYQYVEYQVLKRVSLINFIERIESTLSIRWILYMFTTAIMGIYFSKQYIRYKFKIGNKEKLVISIITIVTLMASLYIYPNNTVANKLILNVIPYFLYTLYFLLPLLLAIGLKIKKKNTSNQSQS